MLLTQKEVVEQFCTISALAYKSIADYSDPNDGFCYRCPHSNNPGTFRNDGHIIEYVRQAVVERLLRDGHSIAKGFDPVTGKEKTGAQRAEITPT